MRNAQQGIDLQGNSTTIDSGEALRLVAGHRPTWTERPRETPANHAVDGPLLGNGTVGVAIGGTSEGLRLYLCRNDFWKHEPPGQGGPRPVAWLDLHWDDAPNTAFRCEQNLAEGLTRVTLQGARASLVLRLWVAATDNVLVVEFAAGGGPVVMRLQISPAEGAGSEQASGMQDGIAWASRAFTADVRMPAAAAAAMKTPGADGATVTLAPGQSATVAVAVQGGSAAKDCRDLAVRAAARLDPSAIRDLWRAHTAWWADFWGRSCVEVGDPLLEKLYYQSLYTLGSCSRSPEFPPGLFGNWITTDTPDWCADYHLNYNFMAGFYALYSSDRLEQADPEDGPILAFQKRAQDYARRLLGRRGVLYPVGIGPKGMAPQLQDPRVFEARGCFWGQKSCALYCLVNIAQRWRCTRDPAYARRVYPLVRDVIAFWEDDLEYTGGRYVVTRDSVHEGSGEDVNPILTLGLLRNSLDLALDLSVALGEDADCRPKWRHMLEHLSGWSCAEREGRTVFRYTEAGTPWWNDNTLGIQHIYPGNAIGLDSDGGLREIARNTIAVMNRWADFNGTNSLYPAAARVGWNAEDLLARLHDYAARTYPNGFQRGNPHGIENCSTVPNTINEMLCMSHVSLGAAPGDRLPHLIRLFPVWPRGRDARFSGIRCWGAFLVSSELRDGRVQFVRLHSERGGEAVVLNPWPGEIVALSRRAAAAAEPSDLESLQGEVLRIRTAPGETIWLGQRA